MLLSPLDWALIESWQEREIPLRIILRGIESVFDTLDKNPNRRQTVKSLSYCRDEIEAKYADWMEMQIGKTNNKNKSKDESAKEQKPEPTSESTLFSNEAIRTHLENVFKSIEKAKANSVGELRRVLDKVLLKISEQKKIKIDAESLEESLNGLEELIDGALLKTIDEEKLSAIKKEIEKELVPHKSKMETDVYQRTFDLMLLKSLREKAEIPRLSLFYL